MFKHLIINEIVLVQKKALVVINHNFLIPELIIMFVNYPLISSSISTFDKNKKCL